MANDAIAKLENQPEKQKGRWSSIISMAFALVVDNSENGLVNSLFPAIRDALSLNTASLGVFSSIKLFSSTSWHKFLSNGGSIRILRECFYTQSMIFYVLPVCWRHKEVPVNIYPCSGGRHPKVNDIADINTYCKR